MTNEPADMLEAAAKKLRDLAGAKHAHVTTTVNGHVVGEFRHPIDDPFVNTAVVVSRRDMLRTLLRGRRLDVGVVVGGDSDAMWRWFSFAEESR